jgi:serine protease
MFSRSPDSTFIVALKIPGTNRGFWLGRSLVDSLTLRRAHAVLQRSFPKVRLVRIERDYPLVIARIESREALTAVRRLPFIDYVEPEQVIGDRIRMTDFSQSGCGINPTNGPFDYVSSGDVISTSYQRANIPEAWELSQGSGVSVGLADAVIDPLNPEIFANNAFPISGFTSGSSGSRTFMQSSPSEGSVCTHAERMAMLIVGPQNGQGNVGVAWKANLRSGAALNNVVIQFGPAMSQVARGVQFAANAYSLEKKVVAMAFGQLTGSDLLTDVITDLSYNHDVLFIGAAGTDLPDESILTFPASIGPVLKVSSVQSNGVHDPGTSRSIYVQLVAVKDNVVGPSHFGTVAPEGYSNTVVPYSTFGGSSGATAVVTGVAALVRAKFPWMSSYQVLDQLVLRSSVAAGSTYSYTKPHVDALAALGGFCGRMVDLPADFFYEFASPSDPPVYVTASSANTCGGYQKSLNYEWRISTDEEPTFRIEGGSSVTFLLYPPPAAQTLYAESGSLYVTVTDPETGRTRQVHTRVHRRTACVSAGEC